MLKKKKYTLIDTLKICFQCNPTACCGILILVTIAALLPSALVILNANFIDSLMTYVSEKTDFNKVLLNIAGLTIVLLVMHFYTIGVRLFKEKINIGLRSKFYPEIIERTVHLKYEYIEKEDTCDLINRIINWPGLSTIETAFDHLTDVISKIIFTAGLTGTIWSISWWFIPVSFVSALPIFICSFFLSKEVYEKVRWNSEVSRKSDYIEFNMLRGRDMAAERNLFDYSEHYNEQFEGLFMKSANMELGVRKKWFVVNKLLTSIVVAVCIVIAFVSLNYLKTGQITIGLFISLITVLFQLEDAFTSQIPDLICSLTEDNEYLKDMTSFMELDEDSETNGGIQAENEDIQTIEFRNVYFKYPGTDNMILNGVSFNIEKGLHYAIVGKNGSGKSTLTKLMLGLYDIDDGEILINGKNIKLYSKEQLYSFFSIVYQDFARYSNSIKDNIGLGDKENADNMEKIESAAEYAGIKEIIDDLEEGYETPLGKVLEGGIDFSGGQWQRIALARSLMKEQAVRILDEPTSALDPLEESRLYKKYSEISKNSTTLFISHRLGSTKLSDKILVLDGGKVVGLGKHDELMNDCLLYRTMFNTQREWYDEK